MARNIKPGTMLDSVLFKSVAGYIASISQERLLYELCLASTTTEVRLDANNLDQAMTWIGTPQGKRRGGEGADGFWYELHQEAQNAKIGI